MKEYRIIKDSNGETGTGRKTCRLYSELDSILGHQRASVPASLLDTGNSSLAPEAHWKTTLKKRLYTSHWLVSYSGKLHKGHLRREHKGGPGHQYRCLAAF
jgi:hypothetical protein